MLVPPMICQVSTGRSRIVTVMSDQVLVEHVSFNFDIELGSLVDVRASRLTTRPCARSEARRNYCVCLVDAANRCVAAHIPLCRSSLLACLSEMALRSPLQASRLTVRLLRSVHTSMVVMKVVRILRSMRTRSSDAHYV